MSDSANAITNRVLLAVPEAFQGSRLWRANVGAGVPYSVIRQAVALLKQGNIRDCIALLQRQQLVRFGTPGQADTSGILAPGGRRVEIEIKMGADRLSADQVTFGAMIQRAGGIYIVARSAEDALSQLGEHGA